MSNAFEHTTIDTPTLETEAGLKMESKSALREAIESGMTEEEIYESGELLHLSKIEIDEVRKEIATEKNKTTSAPTPSAIIPIDLTIKTPDTEKIATTNIALENTFNLAEKIHHAGISEVDLKNIPDWEGLSLGQKFLALEQISQHTLRTVRKLGEERFNAAVAKQAGDKFKTKINKGWKKFVKSVYISKEEKGAIEDVRSGNVRVDNVTLAETIREIKGMDLNVREKNGKAIIMFTNEDPTLPQGIADYARVYNEAGNTLAKIPATWKNKDAASHTDANFFKRENYAKYQEAFNTYIQARQALTQTKFEYYKKQGLPEDEAVVKSMEDIRRSDRSIKILQAANTNPDAVAELHRIESELKIGRLINNENVARATFTSIGMLSRKGAALVAGIGVAPLVAGVMGAVRGRWKAHQKINESAFKAFENEETYLEKKAHGPIEEEKNTPGIFSRALRHLSAADIESNKVGTFINADSQIERINTLIEKLEITVREQDRQVIKDQLRTRLDYIESKQDAGLVRLGMNNPAGKNYDLLEAMSTAEVAINLSSYNESKLSSEDLAAAFADALSINTETKTPKELQERRDTLLAIMTDYNAHKVEWAKVLYKDKETLRGIIVGVGFGVLGQKIKEWGSGLKHLLDHSPSSNIKLVSAVPLTDHPEDHVRMPHGIDTGPHPSTTPIDIKSPAVHLDQNGNIIKDPVVQTTQPIKAPDKIPTDHYTAHSTHHTSHIKEEVITREATPIDHKYAIKDITIDDKNLDQHIPSNNLVPSNPNVDGQNIDGVNIPTEETDISGVNIPKDEVINFDTKGTLDGDTAGTDYIVKDGGSLHVPNTTTHINETTVGYGEKPIAPLLREYNTGGVKDIAPNDNIYNHQGIQLAHNPYENIVNPHHVNDTFNASNHINQGPIKGPGQLSEHYQSVDDIKEFGRSNVVWETQDSSTIQGMTYQEWNDHSDKLFFERNHFEFSSYNQYAKEHELQQLFGVGSKNIVPKVDADGVLRNARHYTMDYYKNTPNWGTVEKVPAREFFNNWNTDLKLIDGSKIPQADLQKLVNSGILRSVTNENGDNIAYEFKGKGELERLAKLYREATPKADRILGNDRPIGNESIESYIGRLTKRIHQAHDGTDYGFKGVKESGKLIQQPMLAPQGGFRGGVFDEYDNTPIYPRYGGYNEGRTWS